MGSVWRVIDSGRVGAAESAAIDEALLESRASGTTPNTLHFYVRARPTVSLGHFQSLTGSVDLERCREVGVEIVRRKSGGGSIFTDPGQLMYGLVVPESALPSGASGSFAVVCSALARAISSLGVEARYRPVNDIEVGGRKVSGSAQLRRKGAVLQHGSIIVDADPELMDSVLISGRPSERVTSIRAVLGQLPSMEVLKAAVRHELSVEFGTSMLDGSLTPEERVAASSLAREVYSDDSWTSKF